MSSVAPVLGRTFLKIFVRDRQAMFFSLFFPLVFMVVFGFASEGEPEPIEVGVADLSGSELAAEFVERLNANPLFNVDTGAEEALRTALVEGDKTLVLVIPRGFGGNAGTAAPAELRVLVDAAQARQLALVLPALEQALAEVERELRDLPPLFDISVEDVQARPQRYIDFLVPGLLAFSLMQLSIAGSGYNIVEFRRKGILKRLFVTPLKARDFILALVLSRAVICLGQLAILIAVAVFYLDVRIAGDPLSLFAAVLLGIAVFLCIGFCIGSLAKTQQTVGAIGSLVIFPQIFLAGIFYPIDALPGLIQPLAAVLPLSFVAEALREIVINGVPLPALPLALAGMLAWLVIGLLLAVRLFSWKDVAA